MPKKDKERRKSSSKSRRNSSSKSGGDGGSGESEESVKVAVRVRPFNKREKDRNATCCVDMQNNQTILTDPNNKNSEPKMFAFDFSYWSFDGGKERADGFIEPDPSHANSKKYCDQNRVFKDLGEGILKNAWEGYNSTLFAYGQTGSGKSYSVVGYGANKGIIPVLSERLFQDMSAKGGGNNEVTFSMVEIYNEVVRDLLNEKCDKKKGLRVREHSKKGFYADGMTTCAVDSYEAIQAKMDEGTTSRTIASTNMNATSSRAHTIVTITFIQKSKNSAGEEVAKSSQNCLVDLAGSERVASTGAKGDRLKEGAAINQSLSALGNCISALADQSQGKKVKVPYRDSVLTKLLMNALGGNSKTVMVAAISPADINFDESLSTLRYADRAKQIKTKAVVNEDPTEKLIRELEEENKKLKDALKKGGVAVSDGQSKEDAEDDSKAQMNQNSLQIEEMRKSYEQKLREAQANGSDAAKMKAEKEKQRGKNPHIYNLNMDPQLNGTLVHILKLGGKTKLGNQKGEVSDIVMMGPSVIEQHALFTVDKNAKSVKLEKLSDKAKVLVNGQPLTQSMDLFHNDRLLFGTTQLYLFQNPLDKKSGGDSFDSAMTWEMAQEEIANKSGFDMQMSPKTSQDQAILQDQLLSCMPAVEEANSISESLDKMTKFELLLVSKELLNKREKGSEVYIRVRNFSNGLIYDWSKEKFLNRFYKMQELYEDVEEGEVSMKNLPDDQDPFTEPVDQPCQLGTCSVYLKSLAYCIEMKTELEIVDFRGNEVGLLNVELSPCDQKGKEFDDNYQLWVDNPRDLVNKDYSYKVKIHHAMGIPQRYTDIYCRYQNYNDKNYTETKKIPDICPKFKHEKQFSIKPLTEEALAWMSDGFLLIEVWGIQVPLQRDRRDRRNTAVLMQTDAMQKGSMSAANNNTKVIDIGKVKSDMEANVLRRRAEKMESKVHYLREVVNYSDEHKISQVQVSVIKGILDAPNEQTLEKWRGLFEDTKGSNGYAQRSASSYDSNPNRVSKSSACTIS